MTLETSLLTQPTKFGPYLLLERISLGGMAEVFKAIDFGVDGFERTVAVKRILPHVAEDDEFITMFKDEARIAVQLQHGNIAQIYSLGHESESFYIALEYVAGRDLRTIFERCRKQNTVMPIAQTCFIMMKVCEGLDYAHNKKDPQGQPLHIIHRDVSPPNILVSYEGEVKLCDFGVAKAAGRVSQTQAGILKGKFGYMSPEQVRGHALDRRSDVFAAGVCLWELLTGRRLFHGDTDFSTLEKVRSGEVQPPREINPEIPAELEVIVMEALAAEPDERLQSASALHDRLQAFLFSQGLFFSRKDLASWMRVHYAGEIEGEKNREQDRRGDVERYKAAMSGVSRGAEPVASSGGGIRRSTVPPPPPPSPSGRSGNVPVPREAVGAAVSMAQGERRHAPPKPRGRAKTLLTSALALDTMDQEPGLMSRPTGPVPIVTTRPPAEGLDWDEDELETRLFEGEEESRAASRSNGAEASVSAQREAVPPPAPSPRPSSVAEPPPPPRPQPSRAPERDVEDGSDTPRRARKTRPRAPTTGRSLPRPGDVLPPRMSTGLNSSSPPDTQRSGVFRGSVADRFGPATSMQDYGPAMGTAEFLAVSNAGRRKGLLWGGLAAAVALLFFVAVKFSGDNDEPSVANAGTTPAAATPEPAPAPKVTGIKVRLNPPDARLTIDGVEYCCAEERIADRLAAGRHRLRVEAGDQFFVFEEEVDVQPGQLSSLQVTLAPRDVQLQISAEPSRATIYLLTDGKSRRLGRGSAEYELRREEGVEYAVRATAGGYESQDIPLDFSTEREKRLDIELEAEAKAKSTRSTSKRSGSSSSSSAAKTALLKIGAKLGLPPATVYLDNRRVGKTPININVTPGGHRIKWEWDDGKSSSKSVSVSNGEAKTVFGGS